MTLHFSIQSDTTDNELRAMRAAINELLGGDTTPTPSAKSAPAPEPVSSAPPAEEKSPEPAEGEASSFTKQDAIDRASKLISEGKTGKVKPILTDIGVKRVSELSDDQVAVFMAETDGL